MKTTRLDLLTNLSKENIDSTRVYLAKRSIALAVSSITSVAFLVRPVFAAPQIFVGTFASTNKNTNAMTRSNLKIILERQPKLIAMQPRNYSIVADYLIEHRSLIQQIISTTWNDAGKGIAAQQIKDQIDNHEFSDGVSGYHSNVSLSGIAENNMTLGPDPNQVTVKLVIPGNNVEFKTTTPCVHIPLLGCVGAGSYADPSFRVGFDLTANLTISVGSNSFLKVVDINVQIGNASIHGSNAVGTVIETLGDFFTGGDFSRNITSKVNQSIEVKSNLAEAIKTAIDREVPPLTSEFIEMRSPIINRINQLINK